MVGIDFDFARYVSARRGQIEQRLRDGGAYAYAGELKFRRTLNSARPVLIALEATSRVWRARGRKKLLEQSTQANDRDFPAVYACAQLAARRLNLPSQTVLVRHKDAPVPACALGVDDDAMVVVSDETVKHMGESELVAVIARELAAIQNDHILYGTALYYLRHQSMLPIRWAVGPAIIALSAWARRADITCDRAALLATGSLEVTISAIAKLDNPSISDQDLAQLVEATSEPGKAAKVRAALSDHAAIPQRVAALRVFAETGFFKRFCGEENAKGRTTQEADKNVAEMLKVMS